MEFENQPLEATERNRYLSYVDGAQDQFYECLKKSVRVSMCYALMHRCECARVCECLRVWMGADVNLGGFSFFVINKKLLCYLFHFN